MIATKVRCCELEDRGVDCDFLKVRCCRVSLRVIFVNYCFVAAELVTKAHGDVSDKVGRPCEVGQIGLIDPDSRLIVLHLYDGNVKVRDA